MRWSKIKNIIILLLLAVNVCLLAMVGFRAARTARSERETRARMVTVLKRSGITFLPEEVPGEMPLSSQRVTLTVPGEAEMTLLLGTLSQVEETSTRTTYVGEKGTAFVTPAGEVTAQFNAGACPLNGADAAQEGLELLKSLGVQAAVESRETSGEEVRVAYTQLWGGVPVPEARFSLTLSYVSGALSTFSGHLLVGPAEPLTAETPITASTALSRFLEGLNQEGYVCSQISDMYAGYAPSGTGSVTLTPTWYLETDAWPWRFAVNALTGAVTAAE